MIISVSIEDFGKNKQQTTISMKKLQWIFAATALTLFPLFSYSQGIGLGIKAGMNFANQNITDISTDTRTGFVGGGYVVINFSDKWGLQPEILFSSQGHEFQSEPSEYNYMTIPVLLRYKPISFLSFEAGPQFSRLLEAKNDNGSFTDSVKSSDFGLAVGATAHLPLGFNGGARYVWGFTNVSDVQSDPEVKNTVFQLFVGWTIFGAK